MTHLTLRSYKKVNEKLLKDLRVAMNFVNKNSKSQYISFDILGQFMYNIGIYKILFNPAYCMKLNIDGELETQDERYKSKKFFDRREKEIDFHLHFWKLLNHMKIPMIDGELVLQLVKILYDLGGSSLDELASSIERNFY